MDDHRNAHFAEADFSGAHFRGVDFSHVKITDAWLVDVELSGHVSNLSVNGIDVSGYVEEELDKRHPERRLLAAPDPDGVRTAWQAIERFTAATIDRARRLPPERLDESVDDEWSFLQTQRHLVFATDRWITGPVWRDASPFHPLGMPNPPLDEVPPGVFDLDARPSFDDVMAVRRGRMDRVAAYLAACRRRRAEPPRGIAERRPDRGAQLPARRVSGGVVARPVREPRSRRAGTALTPHLAAAYGAA